jgi:hypothetical protein
MSKSRIARPAQASITEQLFSFSGLQREEAGAFDVGKNLHVEFLSGGIATMFRRPSGFVDKLDCTMGS